MHEEALILHGGPEGVRDLGLLESALARPKNLLACSTQEDLPTARFAATYAKGIVANHPFVDGNERIAFTVSVTFLKLNGLGLTATKEDRVLTFWVCGRRHFRRSSRAMVRAQHDRALTERSESPFWSVDHGAVIPLPRESFSACPDATADKIAFPSQKSSARHATVGLSSIRSDSSSQSHRNPS